MVFSRRSQPRRLLLINRELYLGRSQGPTTWNAITRCVYFTNDSGIKFEPQSTTFVVIRWKWIVFKEQVLQSLSNSPLFLLWSVLNVVEHNCTVECNRGCTKSFPGESKGQFWNKYGYITVYVVYVTCQFREKCI